MKVEKLQSKGAIYSAKTNMPYFIIPHCVNLLINSIEIYLFYRTGLRCEEYKVLSFSAQSTPKGLKIIPEIPDNIKKHVGKTPEFYLKAERIIDGVKLTILAEEYKSEELIKWSEKYNVVHINANYNGSNYQKKPSRTDEVLIMNYGGNIG